MDPLTKEYQTSSETITNIADKDPHDYAVLSEPWGCEQAASEHASHSALMTEVNHCDLCGLVFHGRTWSGGSLELVEVVGRHEVSGLLLWILTLSGKRGLE